MRIFVVDAFTDTPFRGNPAAVVLVDDLADGIGITDAWMQSLAAEMKHSETAYVQPQADGSFGLRWFTPAAEVDLCGHATLASAHVLHSTGVVGPYVFHTRSGELVATVGDLGIALDFPAKPVHPTEVAGLAEALGVDVVGCWSDGSDILAEVASADVVRGLAPDIAALARVPSRGVVVTAPGADGADFVSRFFAPRVGVDEDPVTGSAHCALAPFWAQRLGRTDLVGAQLSERGGRVGCSVRGQRVVLSGSAVTVLAGELA